MHSTVVIVGLGEVGKPLLEIMKSRNRTFGVDINQPASISQCDVMHICFPFQGGKFVGQVVEYIHQYRPALTVINSTVENFEEVSIKPLLLRSPEGRKIPSSRKRRISA